jgi:hypothetical protein
MKTQGMTQQLQALREMNGREAYGLFMEQGTGKTWTLLADAERLFAAGKIDAALVIAPKGVHTNWVRREIPTHMDAPLIARAWKSGAGKKEMAKIDEIMKPREDGEPVRLRVLAMNIDALNTEAKGESLMCLWVDTAILEHHGVHHSGAENRHPAVFASRPRNVNGDRWLSERVIPWPKPGTCG